MTTLLHLDASVRGKRSLSRRLSRAFVDAWLVQVPDTLVIRRDLTASAPPLVDQEWIAASFTHPDARTPEMREALGPSDELIDELEAADFVVPGTPMFNNGMPARLKAWVDQVIRVGRTFSTLRAAPPPGAAAIGQVTGAADLHREFGFEAGGTRAHMNHLDTHIEVIRSHLGMWNTLHIGVEYQEFGDGRHAASLRAALTSAPAIAQQIAAGLPGRAAAA